MGKFISLRPHYIIIVPKLSVLIIDSKHIQALMNLGLTLLQAKTYLTLTKLGKADIKGISKASNVVREEIYRIMPKLEKIGLVEKIVGRPTVYEALPLKEGLSMLLISRTEEKCQTAKENKNVNSEFTRE